MDLPIGGAGTRACAVAGVCCARVCGHGGGESSAGRRWATARDIDLGAMVVTRTFRAVLDSSTPAVGVGGGRDAPGRDAVRPPCRRCAQNMRAGRQAEARHARGVPLQPGHGPAGPEPAGRRARADRGRRGLQERRHISTRGRSRAASAAASSRSTSPTRRTRSSSRSSRRCAGTYHGEGAHVVTLDIPGGFKGDVLAVNNEPCAANGVGRLRPLRRQRPGQPEDPGAGRGRPVARPRRRQSVRAGHAEPRPVSNSAHSIFIWQDDGRRTR